MNTPGTRTREPRAYIEPRPVTPFSKLWKNMAGGLGFEPRLAESESAVLPLDDPPPERRARYYIGRRGTGQRSRGAGRSDTIAGGFWIGRPASFDSPPECATIAGGEQKRCRFRTISSPLAARLLGAAMRRGRRCCTAAARSRHGPGLLRPPRERRTSPRSISAPTIVAC